MVNLVVGFIIWATLGGILGFYVAYAKSHDPRLGIGLGAGVGVLVGELGMRLGLIDTLGAALVTLIALAGIAGLLVPFGTYQRKASLRTRITMLAYALSIPTVLIVIGIVIFPLVWNAIFSLRDIEVADLATVELFDLSELSLDNFEAQMGFRIDRVPCERTDTGECAVDEEGNIEYQSARRIFDDYRGYREVNSFPVGEESYVIGVRNREFYPMIWRSIFYTLMGTILAIFLGLVAALVVRDKFPGRNIFRGFILFPYIAPVISVAFIWQVLLRPGGLIPEVLNTDISYLSTNETFAGIAIPLIVAILFQAWRYFPFAFLFLLARLQAIPDDMYEAAKVDGATPIQRMWFITLPQLRAVFGTLFLLRFIWTFNKFDDIFLLTGETSETRVLPIQIFNSLFTEGNVGEASAVAVIMAFMLAITLAIYFRYFLVEDE